MLVHNLRFPRLWSSELWHCVCNPVSGYQHLKGICCLHFQGQKCVAQWIVQIIQADCRWWLRYPGGGQQINPLQANRNTKQENGPYQDHYIIITSGTSNYEKTWKYHNPKTITRSHILLYLRSVSTYIPSYIISGKATLQKTKISYLKNML